MAAAVHDDHLVMPRQRADLAAPVVRIGEAAMQQHDRRRRAEHRVPDRGAVHLARAACGGGGSDGVGGRVIQRSRCSLCRWRELRGDHQRDEDFQESKHGAGYPEPGGQHGEIEFRISRRNALRCWAARHSPPPRHRGARSDAGRQRRDADLVHGRPRPHHQPRLLGEGRLLAAAARQLGLRPRPRRRHQLHRSTISAPTAAGTTTTRPRSSCG